MARSDLLVSLVKAGSSGDTARARSVAEAIIAEERVKRHNVLADRLTDAMRVNGAVGHDDLVLRGYADGSHAPLPAPHASPPVLRLSSCADVSGKSVGTQALGTGQ